MNNQFLEAYNSNLYLKTCKIVGSKLEVLQEFLMTIRSQGEFHKLNNLDDFYSKLFIDGNIENYFSLTFSQIHKPFYIVNPPEYTRSNSIKSIFITITDECLVLLDKLYDNFLLALLRVFKSLFNFAENPNTEIGPGIIQSMENTIEDILKKTDEYFHNIENKELLEKKRSLVDFIYENLPFPGFYHMTNVYNLPGILQNGLLSRKVNDRIHNNIKNIANPIILKKRDRIESYYNRNIQDYIPLYINPVNPMMKSKGVANIKNELIIIEIIPNVLVEKEKTLFSDGNVSEIESNLFHNQLEMENLNWELLQKGEWNYSDDSQRVMCSEILVPDMIENLYISKIIYNVS